MIKSIYDYKTPILAITMGDPNGIGAEVLIRALDILKPFNNWKPLVFGDLKVLENVRKQLGLKLEFKVLKKKKEALLYEKKNNLIPVLDLGED